MKILEFMSFNVEWFLTTQGMLITGGVLLLLIALIILLTSGKKDKEEEDVTASIAQAAAEASVPLNQNVEQQVTIPEMPVLEPTINMPQNNIGINNEPVNTVNQTTDVGIGSVAQPIEAAIPAININTEPSIEQPVVSEVVAPSVLDINPIVSEQPVSPVIEPAPAVATTPEVSMPEFNINANPTAGIPVQPASQVSEQPTVSIYGGASPMQNIYNPAAEQEKPVIYGGADPLENTAPIPKMEIPVAPVEEARVVEPVIPTQTFTQTAVVDNSVNNTIPAVEPISQIETPTASTVEPTGQNEEIETLVF